MRRMRHLKPREIQGCDIAYDFSNATTLYDATTGGNLVAADGAIARAEDISGNGNHMTQAASGSRPLRKVASQNGLDSALFDGSNDVLSAGDVADMLDKPVHIFSVHKWSSGANTALLNKASYVSEPRWGLLILAGDIYAVLQTNAHYGITTPATDASSHTTLEQYSAIGKREVGSSAAVLLRRRSYQQWASNTVTENRTSHNTALNTRIGINDGPANYYGGYVCETAKYSAELNDAQIKRIEGASMRKWRING